VKYLSSLWVWPGPLWHAVVAAAGGLGGWALCQWKNER